MNGVVSTMRKRKSTVRIRTDLDDAPNIERLCKWIQQEVNVHEDDTVNT